MAVWYDKSGGRTKCSVGVYYERLENGASFYFTYAGQAETYWLAPTDKHSGYWAWYTNSAGYVQMDVNGTYTNQYAFTYAHSKGDWAGTGGSAWKDTLSGTSDTITLGPTNDGYTITVHWSGSINTTDGTTVYYTFNLPIYINDDGEVNPFTKVYINDNGTIRECDVYINVDGSIKQIK